MNLRSASARSSGRRHRARLSRWPTRVPDSSVPWEESGTTRTDLACSSWTGAGPRARNMARPASGTWRPSSRRTPLTRRAWGMCRATLRRRSVLRPRDDRSQRGSGHVRVPDRLRLVRGRRLLQDTSVPAGGARRRAGDAAGLCDRSAPIGNPRQLQRQVVRCPAHRDTLRLPSSGVGRTRAAPPRRAASSAAVLG